MPVSGSLATLHATDAADTARTSRTLSGHARRVLRRESDPVDEREFELAWAIEIHAAHRDAGLVIDELRDLRVQVAGEEKRRECRHPCCECFHGMPARGY